MPTKSLRIAVWTIASGLASSAAARVASASSRSTWTYRQAGSGSGVVVRTIAATSSPRAAATATTFDPTNPAPPVTRMRTRALTDLVDADRSSFVVRAQGGEPYGEWCAPVRTPHG